MANRADAGGWAHVGVSRRRPRRARCRRPRTSTASRSRSSPSTPRARAAPWPAASSPTRPRGAARPGAAAWPASPRSWSRTARSSRSAAPPVRARSRTARSTPSAVTPAPSRRSSRGGHAHIRPQGHCRAAAGVVFALPSTTKFPITITSSQVIETNAALQKEGVVGCPGQVSPGESYPGHPPAN
jgi:hypothetical protein